MKYINHIVEDNEHIHRKKFNNIIGGVVEVTCASKMIGNELFCGFAVKSPRETSSNNKLALMIARGRLRKAIETNTKTCYPDQRWLRHKDFLSFEDEILVKIENAKGL